MRDEEPPDDTVVVVRGGLAAADSIRRTAEVSYALHGFYGVSVYLAFELTLEELVHRVPELSPERYKQLRTTTVRQIQQADFELLAFGRVASLRRRPRRHGRRDGRAPAGVLRTSVRKPRRGRDTGGTMTWDLWIDYQARREDGLTPTLARFAQPGVSLEVGAYVVVGADDAELAVAEVVEVRPDGVVLLRVLPGPASDHLELLSAERAGS
jgi:hypothetical protein